MIRLAMGNRTYKEVISCDEVEREKGGSHEHNGMHNVAEWEDKCGGEANFRSAFKPVETYCLRAHTCALSASRLHSHARIGSCLQRLFDVCWLSCFWCIVFQGSKSAAEQMY